MTNKAAKFNPFPQVVFGTHKPLFCVSACQDKMENFFFWAGFIKVFVSYPPLRVWWNRRTPFQKNAFICIIIDRENDWSWQTLLQSIGHKLLSCLHSLLKYKLRFSYMLVKRCCNDFSSKFMELCNPLRVRGPQVKNDCFRDTQWAYGMFCLCVISLVSITLLQQWFSAMQLQEQQLWGFWFLGIGLAKEGESGQSVLWCRNSRTALMWCTNKLLFTLNH